MIAQRPAALLPIRQCPGSVPLPAGLGVQIGPDSVFRLDRIRCSDWPGFGVQIAPDPAYLILCLVTQSIDARAVLKVGLGVGVGFGLSAFYWFPAWWERDLVDLEKMMRDLHWTQFIIYVRDLGKFSVQRWPELLIIALSLILACSKRSKESGQAGLMRFPFVPFLIGIPLIMCTLLSALRDYGSREFADLVGLCGACGSLG